MAFMGLPTMPPCGIFGDALSLLRALDMCKKACVAAMLTLLVNLSPGKQGTALCGSKPKHVWVIEDDAGYSGDLLQFLRDYELLDAK